MGCRIKHCKSYVISCGFHAYLWTCSLYLYTFWCMDVTNKNEIVDIFSVALSGHEFNFVQFLFHIKVARHFIPQQRAHSFHWLYHRSLEVTEKFRFPKVSGGSHSVWDLPHVSSFCPHAQVSNSIRTELWVKLLWFVFSLGDLEMTRKLLSMHEECILNWSGSVKSLLQRKNQFKLLKECHF